MEQFVEAMSLHPCVFLQASADNFRIHRVAPWDGAPAPIVVPDQGNVAVTRQVMAGAFYAGSIRNQDVDPAPETSTSLLRHIHSLAASFQTTRATPPTMIRVAEHFKVLGRHAVFDQCLRVAKDESGHDTLALRDLASLGLRAEDLVAQLRPQRSLDLVQLFTRLADSEQPVAVFGYAYALERMALFNTAATISAVESVIPTGVKATRCLRVHSSIGSDAGHVAESIEFIAALPAVDRTTIARATYATMCVMSGPNEYPGDPAMTALVERFSVPQTQPLTA